MRFSLLLNDEVQEADAAKLQNRLEALPYVKQVDYISKEEALQEQTEALGTDPTEFIDFNPFYASMEVQLVSAYANTDSIAQVEQTFTALPQVQRVDYQRDLIETINHNISRISLVLLLIGIAALLIVNARSVSDYFKENMQLSVILKPDVSDEDALSYQKSVETLPFIKGTRLVTREEGAAELAGMLGDDFLSVFETSPVPVSLEITLQADYVAPDSVAFVRRTLSASDKVEEVEYQQSLVETLNANLAKISLVLGVFILLMLFISFVLINNTVRLGVFSRRFTVHTMQLVGATRRFIRKPFMNGALLQGLVSSVLALVALAGVLALLRRSFPQMFAVIELRSLLIVAGTVIVCGVAICLLSTYLVVNKLVSLDKDRLYY